MAQTNPRVPTALKAAAAALLLGAGGGSHAEPAVIATVAETEPADQFTVRAGTVPTIDTDDAGWPEFDMPGPGELRGRRFPIETPQMQPGPVQSRRIQLQGLQAPLCIVGPDRRSRRWLQRHHRTLVEAGAQCIVTDVPDTAAFEGLRDAFPRLPMMPAAAGAIADRVKVRRYPVLIGPEYVEQ